MIENRHLRLYRQGLDLLERKRTESAQLESARQEAEILDCSFQPFLLATSRTLSSANPPKLFEKEVLRLRKAHHDRDHITQLLSPRKPMHLRPTRVRPRTSRNNSITVEVTKDGDDGTPVLVGNFTLTNTSKCFEIAEAFAIENGLTSPQKQRLYQQLDCGKRKYFN